ncbi:MAG TPA: SocA family protein [Collinsella ihuae]|uniref:SocA family protein n=1 Tax=Collinsella ihumii TaxID=1720204 RepID=A0A921IPA9_9ACTN|nr:SocA family protein [Collinsella ihumii]
MVYEVAHTHRGRRSIVAADIPGNPEAVSAEDRAVIDAVLESYGSLSGDELEQLSHSEEP